MVEIQCPNCDEDIELEDGDFGLFNCPHCDDEFSWDSETKRLFGNIVKWVNIIGAVIIVIGIGFFVGILIDFQFDPPSGYDGLIIIIPIGIILLGLSINILAAIIWFLRKTISKEEESPSPMVQKLFWSGIVFSVILIFWL